MRTGDCAGCGLARLALVDRHRCHLDGDRIAGVSKDNDNTPGAATEAIAGFHRLSRWQNSGPGLDISTVGAVSW